jgi:serine/threonine protein phosphatase PrpC
VIKRTVTKPHLGSLLQHKAALEEQKLVEEIRNKKNLLYRFFVETKAGCSLGGAQKINQDSYIVEEFGGQDYYGICDGHGTNGHLVSRFLKSMIPKNLKFALNVKEEFEEALEVAFLETNRQLF